MRQGQGPPTATSDFPSFTSWLKVASPELQWDLKHLQFIRSKLAAVTRGEIKKLAISIPPQHYKTQGITVRYPLWRMLRDPGIRVGVGTYNQRYSNKVSRYTRRIVDRLGLEYGDSASVDSWTLQNGSSYIARGCGVGLSGEPLDGCLIDDPFKNREEADSPVIQERVWEWFMDDVTPRVQQGGFTIIIHTRWNAGDLIGRILASEDARAWTFIRLPAVCESQEERDLICTRQGLPLGEPDPLGREPGEALCPLAFNKESLEDKRRVLGIGFESLYQQSDIARGGQFFDRSWLEPLVDRVPEDDGHVKRIRYWDLAASRNDQACFSSGLLLARVTKGDQHRFFIEDIVRGRWSPGERNDRILATAAADSTRKGFERTWFERPVFDKKGEVTRALMSRMAGHPCRADNVGGSGSKELRAEPVSDAARAGLVKCVAASWTPAFLTELEGFPKSTYKDQVDSLSGAFNRISKSEKSFIFSVR